MIGIGSKNPGGLAPNGFPPEADPTDTNRALSERATVPIKVMIFVVLFFIFASSAVVAT